MDTNTNYPTLSAPVLLTSLTHEAAADFVLPEYMPPIRRVVSVEAVPLPESRFLSGTALELGGTLAFAVLYIGEDNAVSCASVTTEYSASCSLGEIRIADAAAVGVDTAAESVNCRVTAPRAFTVRTRMKTHLMQVQPQVQEEKIADTAGNRASAADLMAIERRMETAADVQLSRGETTTAISGSAAAAAGTKFLRAGGAVRIDEAKAENGGVRLSGEVWMHALCRTPDGQFTRVDAKAPFTETVTVSDAAAGDYARGWGRAASVTIRPPEGDAASAAWEIEVDLEAECARTGKTEYTADAYSTRCAAEITVAEQDSLTLLRCGNSALSVSGECGRQSKPHAGESIVDVTATASADHVEVRDGQLILHGIAAVSVLIAAEGDLIGEEFTLPFRCEMPAEAGCTGEILWRCVPQVIAASARTEGEKLAVNLELSVSTLAMAREKIRRAAAIVLDKNAPHVRRDGEIRICFPDVGEPLWEIAKRYAVPRARLGEAELADGSPVVV